MYVQKKEILQPELQLLGSAQAHTPHFKKHDLKIYIYHVSTVMSLSVNDVPKQTTTIPTAGEESYEEESK